MLQTFENTTIALMLIILIISPLLNIYYIGRSVEQNKKKAILYVVGVILYITFITMMYFTFFIQM